jgi:hypothetical protein
MAKNFFYVCAGVLLLALTFHVVTGRTLRIRVEHKDVVTRVQGP